MIMSFNIAERITPRAKLAGIKGSKKQKAELATDLNARFFGMVSDAFEKRGEISKREIRGILKQLCPGVKLAITKNANENCYAFLDFLWDSTKGLIKGFSLELPLVEIAGKKVVKKENIAGLLHETRHIFDAITNSSSSARINSSPLGDKITGFDKRFEKYTNFYGTVLYGFELNREEIIDIMKTPHLAVPKRKAIMRERIEGIFNDPQATSEEKIEMLEKWRYRLQSEENAHIDGIVYQHKFDEIHSDPSEVEKQTQSINAEISNMVVDCYFFSGKIDVIKEMLAEELAKTRNAHAESLGLKGTHHPHGTKATSTENSKM